MTIEKKIIVIGFGNPGRLDDGLGPAFIEKIENFNLPNVITDSNYQLQIEDSYLISQYDIVVFVDADINCNPPFTFCRLKPSESSSSFSTHSVRPAGLLSLSKNIFNHIPDSYLLAIRGYRFNEFGEKLSPKATKNLDAAVSWFVSAIKDLSFTKNMKNCKEIV